MRAYRSQCRQRMSALLTSEAASSSLLATLTAKGNLLAPSMQKWAGHRALLPTRLSSSHRSGKVSDATLAKNSRPVQEVLGRSLSPEWCEWFMAFEVGWTALPDASEPSATQSSPRAPRSSDGPSAN